MADDPLMPQPPDGLSADQALSFAIGHYVRTFANMETIIATHIAYALRLDQKLTFFILKDILVSQKIKLLMRVADQRFGRKRAEPYRAVLNKIDKTLDFRNTLVHGAFIAAGLGQEHLQGKLGRSLTDLVEGMEPIDYGKLIREAGRLDSLAADLIAALPDLDSKPNN